MKKYLFLAGVVFIAACATKKTESPKPTIAPPAISSNANTPSSTIAPKKVASYTPDQYALVNSAFKFDDFMKGKSIYENKCGTCHSLKEPTEFPVELWEDVVPNMVVKYNKKFPDTIIDQPYSDLILNYVVSAVKMNK